MCRRQFPAVSFVWLVIKPTGLLGLTEININDYYCLYVIVVSGCIHSLVPRLSRVFQCCIFQHATLTNTGGPGYEAIGCINM